MTYPQDPYGGSGQPAHDPYQPQGQQPHGEYPPPGQSPAQYPPLGQYGPPGQYPPGQYGPPAYGYPYVQQAGTNGMAIASMVLGILWLYWVGSVLALIFGYVARNQLKQRPQQGNGMAVAGIVLGWVGLGVLLLVLVSVVAVT